MKNKAIKIWSFLLVSLSSVLFLTTKASAADLLPEPIQNLFGLMGDDGSGASEFATSRIRMLLLLGLGALVLAAVVYAAFAAFKYIQSQGDPGKIEEAGKAVKAIFLGLAMMLVAIVGIVLVFVFFGAEFFGTSSYQVCLNAANSPGCLACNDDIDATTAAPVTLTVGNPSLVVESSGTPGGLPDNWDTIKFDTTQQGGGVGTPGAPPAAGTNQQICTFCEWQYFQKSRNNPAITAISAACEE